MNAVYNEKIFGKNQYKKIIRRLVSKHFELEKKADCFEIWSNPSTEEIVIVQF